MLTRIASTKTVVLFFFFVGISTTFGQETTKHRSGSELLEPRDAIQLVRDSHSVSAPTIVSQVELDGLINQDGGGACPIAAGLDALQAFRVMIGLPPHPSPHRVALELFVKRPELREGRISNERFVSVMSSFSSHLEGIELQSMVVSAPNSKHAGDSERWDESKGPDLTTTRGELKVLSFTWTEDGEVRGRHFVLLQSYNEDIT